MRLYNAASCTPCCSSWEDPTRKAPKPVASYVPKSSESSIISEKTEVSVAKVDENKAKPKLSLKMEHTKQSKGKYEYLKKIPSTTTSTTGGETPPFDNTSSAPASDHDEEDAEKKTRHTNGLDYYHRTRRPGTFPIQQLSQRTVLQPKTHGIATVNTPRWKVRREQHILPTKKHEIGNVAIRCDEDDPRLGLDVTTDLESSCSTLTTTRSMKLQQEDQDDCAITVSSFNEGNSHNDDIESPPRPKSTHLKILNIEPKLQAVPFRLAKNLPPVGIVDATLSDGSSSDDSEEGGHTTPPSTLSVAGNRVNDPKSKRADTMEMQSKALLAGVTVPSKSYKLTPKEAPSHGLGLGYEGVKMRLRTFGSTAAKQEKVDFFPVKATTQTSQITSESEAAPRLGVSSRFPIPGGHELERPESLESDQDYWNPFDDESVSSEENNVTESKWVQFTSQEAPLDWDGWHGYESPVAFPIRTTTGDIGACEEAAAGLLDVYNRNPHRMSIDEKHLFDSEKSRTCLPRPDFFHKPKLLGPLLEKRFTQKYWRRLKEGRKNSRKEPVEKQHVDTNNMPKPEPAVEREHLHRQHVEQDQKEQWREFFKVGSIKIDSQDEQETTKLTTNATCGDTLSLDPKPSASPLVLSLQRVEDCQAIIDSVGLDPGHLVIMIDRVDASFPLTRDQVASLFEVLPTPQEKYALLQHLKSYQKPVSLLDMFENKAELTIVQLVGVENAQLKLEALSFQYEFPDLLGKLREDCHLLRKCCDEITQSSRLEKVLGIINMLGNGLVGKTPGKKKTNKISLRSLTEILAESHPMKGSNLPFLAYACTRIQKTKPALLQIREELPSLRIAASEADWDAVCSDLEALEIKFEAFREFALSYSWNESKSANQSLDDMTMEEEIDVLRLTSVGGFAVDACLRMAEFYQDFDEAQNGYENLVQQFVEPRDVKGGPSMSIILATFETFVAYVEKFTSI